MSLAIERCVIFALQALDALIRTGLVAPTPDGIANFIRQAQLHRTGTKIICKLLTPQRFEGVLGSEAAWKAAKPAAVSYMKSSFDFDGMTVVEALRTVLLQVSAPQSTRSVSFLLRMTSARFFHSAVLTHPGTPIATFFPTHGTCAGLRSVSPVACFLCKLFLTGIVGFFSSCRLGVFVDVRLLHP